MSSSAPKNPVGPEPHPEAIAAQPQPPQAHGQGEAPVQDADRFRAVQMQQIMDRLRVAAPPPPPPPQQGSPQPPQPPLPQQGPPAAGAAAPYIDGLRSILQNLPQNSGQILGGLGSVVQGFIAGLQQPAAPQPHPKTNVSHGTNAPHGVDEKSLGGAAGPDGIEVLRWDSSDVVQLCIGGKEFSISRRTLSRIPGLERALSLTDAAAPVVDATVHTMSAAATATVTPSDHKSAPAAASSQTQSHPQGKFLLEGDSEVYNNVFAYARGNRSFLEVMDRRMRRMLRVEAQKLEMRDLVADIDWIICPPAYEKRLESIDSIVSTVWSLLHVPFVHQQLMENGTYRLIHQFIEHRAQEHKHSTADEVRQIVRDFACTAEFEMALRSSVMPSVAAQSPHCESLPNEKPYLFEVWSQLSNDVLQFAAPLVGAQMLRNYLGQQLRQYFAPNNPPQHVIRHILPHDALEALNVLEHQQGEDFFMHEHRNQDPHHEQPAPQQQPRFGANHPDPDHPKNVD